MGRSVISHRTQLGPLHCMAQNPHNAIIHLGHNNGRLKLLQFSWDSILYPLSSPFPSFPLIPSSSFFHFLFLSSSSISSFSSSSSPPFLLPLLFYFFLLLSLLPLPSISSFSSSSSSSSLSSSTSGTVTLWSPNVHSPLVKVLCHSGPLTDLAVEHGGWTMVTVGMDARMKIWDIRSTYQYVSYM